MISRVKSRSPSATLCASVGSAIVASPGMSGQRICVAVLFILGPMHFGHPGQDCALAPAYPKSLMKFEGITRLHVYVLLVTLAVTLSVTGRPLLERCYERG